MKFLIANGSDLAKAFANKHFRPHNQGGILCLILIPSSNS